MAERFEKPKKFTKEWVRYIYDYYRTHILVAIFALVLLVITIVELSGKVYFEVNINFVATDIFPIAYTEAFAEKAEGFAQDADGDGETNVSFTQINFTSDAMQDANQIMALESKLMTVFASNEEMLFVFDEPMLEDVLSMSATEGVFVPVEEWCAAKTNQEQFYEFAGGNCAVHLKNSAILKELGINGENLYVAVRMNYKPEDELLTKQYENCVAIANALVEE